MVQKKFVLKELSQATLGTLGSFIVRNALLYPNKEAFIYGDRSVTFGEYNKRVNSLIHALHDMGVKKQDVIGVLSWNCLEYQDVYGAAEKGGFIIASFNARLSLVELDYLINDSTANTLFVGPELVGMVNDLKHRIPSVKNIISLEQPTIGMEYHGDLLKNYPSEEPEVTVEKNDLVYLFYTSGTTGEPKGAVFDHGGQFEHLLITLSELAILPEDSKLTIMPMFHVAEGMNSRIYFGKGCLNVILKQFDPRVTLETIQYYQITDILTAATHLAVMLELPDFEKYADIRSIKRMFYGASPMPQELLKRLLRVWGPIFLQVFAQTESGTHITWLKQKDHDVSDKPPEIKARVSSVGQPIIGSYVRIVDEKGNDVLPGEVGEIIVKSRYTMVEYWHKPEETAKALVDGWLHTGDLGRYDELGYIFVTDRKKDMIISGGENIYPTEVEQVLYRHPAVRECCVIGIPDPKWVESVHAIVSFKRGMAASPEELIEFCKQNIARYKAPRSVEILDELPKTSIGKILKRELKEKYWAEEGKVIL